MPITKESKKPRITRTKDLEFVDFGNAGEIDPPFNDTPPIRSLGSIVGKRGHGRKILEIRGNTMYQTRSPATAEVILNEGTGNIIVQRTRFGRATGSDKPPVRLLWPSKRRTPHEKLQALRGETPNTQKRLARRATLSEEQEKLRRQTLITNKPQTLP